MAVKCILCRYARWPGLFLALAAALLLLLWLGRAWLWVLLVAYLGLAVLLGLIVLAWLATRVLTKLCWKWSGDPKGAGSQGHPKTTPVNIPPTIYKRPDPLLYSQPWLLARGLAVTWDNPDIAVFEAAPPHLPAQPHALLPATPYLIRARIWNGSTEAPAVSLPVQFAYLTFGIGVQRTVIGETMVPALPVKGAAGLPVVAEMAWTTPAVAGHYCLQVELLWNDDADPGNNLGQTNLDVKKLNSPNASFTFLLRNDGRMEARMRLTTDAYSLPPLPDCAAAPQRGGRIAAHTPQANPVPPGWQIDLGGAEDVLLAPSQERVVTVNVTAPDGFAGELDINVNAFDGLRPAGGVTLRVHS